MNSGKAFLGLMLQLEGVRTSPGALTLALRQGRWAGSLTGVKVGVNRWVGPGEWLRWFAHPFGGVVCRDHAQYSAFAPQFCPSRMSSPMDCSTPGFPVYHQLPEHAQTHVHRVGDAIQPSHPLLSPSPAFSLSQHQGLFPVSQFFTSGGQSMGVSASASVLPVNIQDWFPLGSTGWIYLQSKELSGVFSNSWKASILLLKETFVQI